MSEDLQSKLPSKYRNLSKKEWVKFVNMNIPAFCDGEKDLSGSNFRMECEFCNLQFSGTKTRVVGHLIGDPQNVCPNAPILQQLQQLGLVLKEL